MTERNISMAGPLSGLRVVELARILAGPWAGQVLADLGADVIKVERSRTGDDTRAWGPPFVEGKDGGLAKFGLDYKGLAPECPRLIYCSVTGFGQDGPYATRAGYDLMAQGMGGFMSLTGM